MNIGDNVIVSDGRGHVECRGIIMGCHQIVGGDVQYDVQPYKEWSLSHRICGIPACRVKLAKNLPYEGRRFASNDNPVHILDHV